MISMDQAVGYGMISLATAIFSYYTVWVIILPFVEPDHMIHGYFLPRIYGITIPIVAGVIALIGLGSFIGVVMLRSRKPKPKTD